MKKKETKNTQAKNPTPDPEQRWDDVDKTGMILNGYVKANNELMRQISNTISHTAMCVYLLLLSHKNFKTGICKPSQELLAREINLSDRQIRNVINDLISNGFIERRTNPKDQRNNYYTFPYEEELYIAPPSNPQSKIPTTDSGFPLFTTDNTKLPQSVIDQLFEDNLNESTLTLEDKPITWEDFAY